MCMAGAFCAITFMNLGIKAYTWNGESFKHKNTEYFGKGRIVEYSNQEEFCNSWFAVGAMSLTHPVIQAIAYALALAYLFVGIAIISDIFME